MEQSKSPSGPRMQQRCYYPEQGYLDERDWHNEVSREKYSQLWKRAHTESFSLKKDE